LERKERALLALQSIEKKSKIDRLVHDLVLICFGLPEIIIEIKTAEKNYL